MCWPARIVALVANTASIQIAAGNAAKAGAARYHRYS
jgi:hypothetical protein